MNVVKPSYTSDFLKSVTDFGFDPYNTDVSRSEINNAVVSRVMNSSLGDNLTPSGELHNDLYNSFLAGPQTIGTQTSVFNDLPSEFDPTVPPPTIAATEVGARSSEATSFMKGAASATTAPFRYMGSSFGPGVAFGSTMVGQAINGMYEAQVGSAVDYANDRFRYGPGNSISKENYLGSVRSDVDTEKSIMNVASLFGPVGLAIGGIANSFIHPGSGANLATSFSTGGGMIDATYGPDNDTN